jgi:hypothetical protein
MRQFVCAECQVAVRPTAVFVSGEQTFWSALPAESAEYEATCGQRDGHVTNGIHGCPFMRLMIDQWLTSGSGDGASASRRFTDDDIPSQPIEQLVASSEPASRFAIQGESYRWTLPEHKPEAASVAKPDAPVVMTMSPTLPAWDESPTADPDLRDIMMHFQSLGDNCEFGLLQRWAQAEPLDLLRFAGLFIPVEQRLRGIIDALMVGFSGLGEEPSSIHCELQGDTYPRPYMVRETRWNLRYHIDEDEETTDPRTVHRQQVVALRFRHRKLLEDLREAHRVFVWKSNVATREAEVRELVACLRRHGPNLLLWVDAAGSGHRAGSVEYAGSGLLKGYVDRFAPYDDATDIDAAAWYDVCRRALDVAEALGRHGERRDVTQR